MSELLTELNSPHTFAIIFHSEAGRTTLTQKLLLFGDAIQCVDLAMSRKISRDVTSNWMDIEKQGGISITTSVIQFEHKDCILYLFDTPCHEFFSEDAYGTLAAVDMALMVIDSAKGAKAH